MKRFIAMIVAACAFFVASAQYPMVTLSHNGELSFFDDLYAFEAAYNQAENGDTLYLSEGEFILNGGSFTIQKRLSVVGNGYGSYILGNLSFDMRKNPNSEMDAPLFDGVRLDKVSFQNLGESVQNLRKSEIRRCRIGELENGSCAGNDVCYDKCYIEKAVFGQNGSNVVVKNSKLGGKSGHSDLSGLTAINCHISEANFYPSTMISSVFKKTTASSGPHLSGDVSLINSVLDFSPKSNNIYMHDCYIYSDAGQPLLDENMDCLLNLEELGYLGQDGTVAGIMGGEYPFTENPSVPTVDTSNSSVEYDEEADRLKVSIKINAD